MDRLASAPGRGPSYSSPRAECLRTSPSGLNVGESGWRGEVGERNSCEWRFSEAGYIILDSLLTVPPECR